MRLAIITRDYQYSYGGIATLTKALGENLKRKGVDVHIYYGKQNTKTLLTPFRVNLGSYDVVHVTSSPYGAFVRKNPLVVNVQQPALAEMPYYRLADKLKAPVAYPLEALSLRNASSVVVISEQARRELLARYPVSKRKLTVVPGGVDLDKFKPIKQRTEDAQKLLICSRLEPRKNVSEAIRALANLKQHNLQAAIVGEGSEKKMLKQLAESQSVNVDFKGRVNEEELPKYFNEATIFVTCSRAEGFGLSLLQAMASGCAVVASNIPPHTDLVKHGMNGIIYDSPKDLQEALANLAFNPVSTAQLGRAARETAKMYSWEKIAERYLQLYEHLLKHRN